MQSQERENKAMPEYKYRQIDGKRIPEHRAVVEELLGISLRKDQVVHHINGDKTDNRPENLQVMDWKEHSRLHASSQPQTPEKQRKVSEARKGKSNPEARALTDKQVEDVVLALARGESVTALARKLDVSDHVIRNIRDGKTYQDVLERLPAELFPLPGAKKRKPASDRSRGFSVEEVTDIRLRLIGGQSVASIAKLYNRTQETIRKIRDHESYEDIPQPQPVAKFRITDDMKKLADIMLQGPMPDEEDSFSFTEDDIQALTGEKVDEILIKKYGLYPTYHARVVYLMMRKALAGDHTMLFALFSISSYDSFIPQTVAESSTFGLAVPVNPWKLLVQV